MKQLVRKGLKEVIVDEVPDPMIIPHHVLVRPIFSLISSGTETASIHQEGVIRAVAENPSHLSKILNVSIAQAPTEPLEPTLPKVWLNLVAGLVWALAAGIAAALWEKERNERVYSAATIEKVTGLSTIAELRNEA